MHWYIDCLKKYAQFSGRARRKEYWMFVLFHVLIAGAFGFLDGLASGPGAATIFANVYQLAVLVPSLAAGVRRMHDTGHSGWWLLVPLVSLVLAVRDGDGDNRFGPDPKAETARSRCR